MIRYLLGLSGGIGLGAALVVPVEEVRLFGVLAFALTGLAFVALVFDAQVRAQQRGE